MTVEPPGPAVVRAYVGLGSNLDDPLSQVQRALDELARLPQTLVSMYSSLYWSDPVGPAGQPEYVNAVAALDTELTAHALLDRLQDIEQAHRRVRSAQRWGPRTLDLDILLYGEASIADDRLTVPHQRLAERSFVLYPLSELEPALHVPGHGPLAALLERCPQAGLRKVSEHL